MNSKILTTICSIIILTVYGSCCKVKLCEGFDQLYAIRLENFSVTELDTIGLSIYEVQSAGAILVDSIQDQAYEYPDGSGEYFLSVRQGIHREHRYVVYIYESGARYTIDNFDVREEECYRCHGNTENYSRLVRYDLNSQTINSNELSIRK